MPDLLKEIDYAKSQLESMRRIVKRTYTTWARTQDIKKLSKKIKDMQVQTRKKH